MSSINATNARKELFRIVDSVNETHEPIENLSEDPDYS